MLSMWKWLIPLIPLIAAGNLFAATDAQIQEFMEKNVAKNPRLTLKSVTVTGRQPVPGLPGWEAVQMKIAAQVTRNGNKQDISGADVLFTHGNYIVSDFIDVNKGSLKHSLKGVMKPEDYRADRIISGTQGPEAKYQIAVFSDPQCPFCINYVPGVIELAQKHPDLITLYYYHMPLATLHPNAPTIVRAALALELEGRKGIIPKIYAVEFKEKNANEAAVLKEFNRLMGSNLKVSDLHTPAIDKHLEEDQALAEKLMVRGTPTFFVNGVAGGEEIVRLEKELGGK
jgi:thiol:disulfide interchange protein DsbC